MRHKFARPGASPKKESGRALRMVKWLALIVLLVLLLLALFLPDRGLAADDTRLLGEGIYAGENLPIRLEMRF